MKTTLLAVLAISLSGCAVIHGHGLTAASCFKDINVVAVVQSNRVVIGYSSSVSGAALGDAVGTAAKVLVKP